MLRKCCLSVLLLVTTSAYCATNRLKNTIICGYFEEYKDSSSLPIKIWVLDEGNIVNVVRDTTINCVKGYFKFELYLSHPVYFSVLDEKVKDAERVSGFFHNQLIHPFIEPHDSIYITIKQSDSLMWYKQILNVQFSGKGVEKNICLQQLLNMLKANEGSILSQSEKGESILAKCYKCVDEFKPKLTSNAVDLLKADIAGIIDGAVYNSLVNADKLARSYCEKIKRYQKQLFAIPIKSSDALEYSGYCKHLLCKQAILKAFGKVNVLKREGYLYDITLKQYVRIITNAYHGKIRYFLLAKPLMDEMVLRNNLSSEVVYYMKQYFFNSEKKNDYKQLLEVEYHNLSRLLRKDILDFNLLDTAGNLVNLTKFKGKLIFIDFMFTGCSWCAKAVPFLSKFEETFKSDTNIVFISLSADANFEVWKLKGIGKYSVQNSTQLNTGKVGFDHSFIRYFNIHAFPTFLLIDKNARILFKQTQTNITDDLTKITDIINTSRQL